MGDLRFVTMETIVFFFSFSLVLLVIVKNALLHGKEPFGTHTQREGAHTAKGNRLCTILPLSLSMLCATGTRGMNNFWNGADGRKRKNGTNTNRILPPMVVVVVEICYPGVLRRPGGKNLFGGYISGLGSAEGDEIIFWLLLRCVSHRGA